MNNISSSLFLDVIMIILLFDFFGTLVLLDLRLVFKMFIEQNHDFAPWLLPLSSWTCDRLYDCELYVCLHYCCLVKCTNIFPRYILMDWFAVA